MCFLLLSDRKYAKLFLVIQMELPKRKRTRIKEYDYSQSGYYFITICTKDKQKILCDIVGGGALDAPRVNLTAVGRIVEKYIISTNNIPELTVLKYVIMPNHIHLLLKLEVSGGTSKAPSPTNSIISHSVSTLKRFAGKEIGENVFQRSFHDHIIRGEKDYLEIWEYIDTNPAKWKEDCFYQE